eukprot:Hpha_TRINITY_DN16406_c3_g5::TRINITY_DN16406_c3_g5_i3::g.160182::m.160182
MGSRLVRQGDTPDEAKIKTIVLPFALFVFSANVFHIVIQINSTNQMMRVIGNGIIGLAMLLFMGGVVCNAIPPGYLLDGALVLTTVGIFAVDLGNATSSYPFRSWTFVVLALDIALAFKRLHPPLFIIPFVLVYQAALGVESVSRFGLYEAGYWGTKGVEVSFCNCASPPCDSRVVDAVIIMTNVCIVFLANFYFTNGFASGMRLQLRRVEASVEVAAVIAAALARYDVDKAEEAIAKDQHLPKELAEAYRRLVSIQRDFKVYLPHSCFVQDPEAEEEGQAADDAVSIEKAGHMSGARYPGSGCQVEPEPERRLRVDPFHTRVSLACSDMSEKGRPPWWYEDMEYATWYAADVESWRYLVTGSGGVVDLIMGDRRYASFNARRQCAKHATRAVDVLCARNQEHEAMEATGCAVTGQGFCGDFGSVSMLRFMVLGPLADSLQPLGRLAALWGLEVFVDQQTYVKSHGHIFLALAVVSLPQRRMPVVLYMKTEPESEVT